MTFKSITVHNKHEGAFDGEFALVAYVQGKKKVDLTAASGPGAGLRDVSNGGTLTFKLGTEADTIIVNNLPFSIFTVGHELDACNDYGFPDDIRERLPIFYTTVLDWSSEISKYQHYLNTQTWVCPTTFGNDDEILGTINELYYSPNYGIGPHELKSSSGDFTLMCTISAMRPAATTSTPTIK